MILKQYVGSTDIVMVLSTVACISNGARDAKIYLGFCQRPAAMNNLTLAHGPGTVMVLAEIQSPLISHIYALEMICLAVVQTFSTANFQTHQDKCQICSEK